MKPAPVDYLILSLYCAFVLGIGWMAGRREPVSPLGRFAEAVRESVN